jgi:hypothetical protein
MTLIDLSLSQQVCFTKVKSKQPKSLFKTTIIITLKSFFLAKRGLAETTISGGLLPQLLRQTLVAGEVEEDKEPLPALEVVPLPTEDAEALPTGDAEALPTRAGTQMKTINWGQCPEVFT